MCAVSIFVKVCQKRLIAKLAAFTDQLAERSAEVQKEFEASGSLMSHNEC